MLGPLKFGLQKTPLAAAVPTVKAAVTGTFELTLSLEGDSVYNVAFQGPKGATAFIDWGDGTNTAIGLTGTYAYNIFNHSCGTTATISGSNLITFINLSQYMDKKIKGIEGAYPTSLLALYVDFNYADPIFTPPNIISLHFYNSSGPASLNTGSNLTFLTGLPPNLSVLDTRFSPKFTTLPTLPAGLEQLSTPPGITVLPALPAGLRYLNLYDSTKLTTLPALPAGLTTLYTPPGLTVLSGVVPNLTILDISRSTKLTTLSIPGAKVTSLTPPASLTTLNVSGCTGLSSLTVPPKVTTLNISKCTGITTVTLPPTLTTLRMDGSGLTSLDLSKTNVSILNMPPSMDAQLKTVLFGSKLKPSGLFRFEVPEDGVWTLY